jgi:hypothetical protein
MRHGRSHREASFYFMDWLSSQTKPPLPQEVIKFDRNLADMLSNCLLVCNKAKRNNLAEGLQHEYFGGNESITRTKTSPVTNYPSDGDDGTEAMTSVASMVSDRAPMHDRHRQEDYSEAWLHQGTLWKLNKNGDPKELSNWLRRDMWIASNLSLCYFSQRDNKRLVLLSAQQFQEAEIARFDGDAARTPAFQITMKGENEDGDDKAKSDSAIFACESDTDYDGWMAALQKVQGDAVMSMKLGGSNAQELRKFRLRVRNRRQNIAADGSRDDFEPVFKATLWKLRADGDRMVEEDWFKREMWLSKNGSLVYFSKKDQKELVYYSQSDIESASVSVQEEPSFKAWGFQVHLPAVAGLEQLPGEFAAESEEMRKTWMREFAKFSSAGNS